MPDLYIYFSDRYEDTLKFMNDVWSQPDDLRLREKGCDEWVQVKYPVVAHLYRTLTKQEPMHG